MPVGLRSYSIDPLGLRLVARQRSYKLVQMNTAQSILPRDRSSELSMVSVLCFGGILSLWLPSRASARHHWRRRRHGAHGHAVGDGIRRQSGGRDVQDGCHHRRDRSARQFMAVDPAQYPTIRPSRIPLATLSQFHSGRGLCLDHRVASTPFVAHGSAVRSRGT